MSVSSLNSVCGECRCSLPNLKLSQSASGRLVGSVRGRQSGQGCWGQRGHDSASGMHKHEHGEKVTIDHLSLPRATYTFVLSEPHVQVQVKAVASM